MEIAGNLSLEERKALYNGFIASDGTQNAGAWKHVYEVEGRTYALFVNGGSTAAFFEETFSASFVITKVLTKGGEASYNGNRFCLSLPPGGFGFFVQDEALPNSLRKDALILHRISSGAVWYGQTAVLYVENGGVVEMLGYVENGKTVKIGNGKYILKGFDWGNTLQPETTAMVYQTP